MHQTIYFNETGSNVIASGITLSLLDGQKNKLNFG